MDYHPKNSENYLLIFILKLVNLFNTVFHKTRNSFFKFNALIETIY